MRIWIHRKTVGFTLIELLIVIGIIVILSVVVVLTLNPAELLKQSRDSRRVSDMSTVQSAIALYLADVSSPNLVSSSAAFCYVHASSGITGANAQCSSRFVTGTTNASSAAITTDSNGWIPVRFTDISSGSPLPALPVDPVNNTSYFMAYRATNTSLTYELNAALESTKYTSGSSSLLMADGGNSSTTYEVGTYPGLSL